MVLSPHPLGKTSTAGLSSRRNSLRPRRNTNGPTDDKTKGNVPPILPDLNMNQEVAIAAVGPDETTKKKKRSRKKNKELSAEQKKTRNTKRREREKAKKQKEKAAKRKRTNGMLSVADSQEQEQHVPMPDDIEEADDGFPIPDGEEENESSSLMEMESNNSVQQDEMAADVETQTRDTKTNDCTVISDSDSGSSSSNQETFDSSCSRNGNPIVQSTTQANFSGGAGICDSRITTNQETMNQPSSKAASTIMTRTQKHEQMFKEQAFNETLQETTLRLFYLVFNKSSRRRMKYGLFECTGKDIKKDIQRRLGVVASATTEMLQVLDKPSSYSVTSTDWAKVLLDIQSHLKTHGVINDSQKTILKCAFFMAFTADMPLLLPFNKENIPIYDLVTKDQLLCLATIQEGCLAAFGELWTAIPRNGYNAVHNKDMSGPPVKNKEGEVSVGGHLKVTCKNGAHTCLPDAILSLLYFVAGLRPDENEDLVKNPALMCNPNTQVTVTEKNQMVRLFMPIFQSVEADNCHVDHELKEEKIITDVVEKFGMRVHRLNFSIKGRRGIFDILQRKRGYYIMRLAYISKKKDKESSNHHTVVWEAPTRLVYDNRAYEKFYRIEDSDLTKEDIAKQAFYDILGMKSCNVHSMYVIYDESQKQDLPADILEEIKTYRAC